MKLPYHMSCQQFHPLLSPLADGRFQIMQKTDLAPLMVGCEYVLVETPFADFLQSLDLPDLQIVDATLYDPRQQRDIRAYKQLRIGRHFTSDKIWNVDLGGERILLMGDENVFVTPLLKERLAASAFKYLEFTEGLSWFAANGISL